MYLIVREIQDIITAPKFIKADLFYLRNLIREHNSLYLELFGYLKPKMHIWLHLVESQLLNGPAIHFWAMPFERKNKEMKDLGSSSNCHINLPWTIAFRNQLHACYLQEKTWSDTNIIIGGILNEFDYEINKVCPNIPYAKTYKFIEIDGKKYLPGSIIVTKIDENKGPVFRQIYKIYCINGHFYFLLNKVLTNFFDGHSFAYDVTITNDTIQLLHIDRYIIKTPCSLIDTGDNYYVMPQYQL